MSDRWNAHLDMVNGLIAAQKAQRAAKAAAAMAAQPAPAAPAPQPFLGLGGGDMWQGGMNGGQVGMPGGIDAGGKPGDMSQLGGMLGNFGPLAGGLLGGLAGTALAGPFGGALGAWGGRALAGLLGGNETNTGAGMLGNDPKDGMPDMMNGGWGDMGAGGQDMGGSNSNAGKEGDTGAMNGFQGGGYTGAGDDGVVQPWRRAGVVHEGEVVIPAHLVRRLGLLSR